MSLLGGAPIVAFVGVSDSSRARSFYSGVLGLPLVEETPVADVYAAGGTVLRVTPVGEVRPQPFTVLGWEVDDIAAVVRSLASAGVSFERFDGMEQDDLGVWLSPSGARVAWFKDPDGNVLSVTQPWS